MDPTQVEQRTDGTYQCRQCGFAWDVTREQALERLKAAADRLNEAVRALDANVIDAPIGEGLWSRRQYVAHIADWASIIGKRLHKLMAEDKPTIEDIDQDALAAKQRYETWDVEESLALYAKGIKHSIEHVEEGGDEGWERVGIKESRGAVPLSEFVLDLVHELEHHLLDIEGNPPA